MDITVQIIAGPQEGKTIDIPANAEVSIGRGEENKVKLVFDGYISTRHASLQNQDGKLHLIDHGSSNGSFIANKRLHPNRPYELKDFFILGSTPFTVLRESSHKKNIYGDPELLSNNVWKDHPVFSCLAEAAAERKTKLIDIPLILSLLLSRHKDVIGPFLSAIEVPILKVSEKERSGDYFNDRLAWINKFIGFQKKAYELPDIYISPLVKRLMVLEAQAPLKEVDKFLESMVMLGTFSLMYPLFDWQRTRTSWSAYFNITINKRLSQSELDKLRKAPNRRFWDSLEKVIQEGKILVLHGRKGAGKSSILNRCFEEGGSLELRLPRGSFRQFFDVRIFSYFHAPNRLNRWLKSMKDALSKPGLVCLDHTAELFEIMNLENIRLDGLLQAIHQRKAHLIISVRTSDLERLRGLVHGVGVVNVERFLFSEHLKTIHHHLERFEREIAFSLSPDVKTFLIDSFTETTQPDLNEFRYFLGFCAARLKDIPDHALTQIDEEQGRSLNDAFFREMVDSWRTFFMQQQSSEFSAIKVSSSMEFPENGFSKDEPPPPPPPETDNFSEDYRGFAVQLEQFVRTYAREAFRTSLNYTDRTTTLDQAGRLTEPEKLEQLKQIIVAMLSSYQASFPTWFETFWNDIEPTQLQTNSKLGNNAKKLWEAYKAKAKKIELSLAEDQFGKQAEKAFQEAWRTVKRS